MATQTRDIKAAKAARQASEDRYDEIMQRGEAGGFQHATAMEGPEGQPCVVERSSYADMYGPTTGDKVCLGDTNLQIQVEYDLTAYGDECKFGGGTQGNV